MAFGAILPAMAVAGGSTALKIVLTTS